MVPIRESRPDSELKADGNEAPGLLGLGFRVGGLRFRIYRDTSLIRNAPPPTTTSGP